MSEDGINSSENLSNLLEEFTVEMTLIKKHCTLSLVFFKKLIKILLKLRFILSLGKMISFRRTGVSVRRESNAVTIVMPAEGPSLGVIFTLVNNTPFSHQSIEV